MTTSIYHFFDGRPTVEDINVTVSGSGDVYCYLTLRCGGDTITVGGERLLEDVLGVAK